MGARLTQARSAFPRAAFHIAAFHIAALCLAALILSAQNAAALEFEASQHDGQRVLLVQGQIQEGDDARMQKWLQANPDTQEILFHSPGGHFYTGLRIGVLLRQLGSATRVPKGATCASACVWAFLGGVLRGAGENTNIGVHMATMTTDKDAIAFIKKVLEDKTDIPFDARLRWMISKIEKASARIAADKAEHLVRMGVSLRLLAPGLDTDQSDTYWLSPKELKSYNVTNSD